MHQALRNAITADEWKNMWEDIESISHKVDGRTLEIRNTVDSILNAIEKLENLQKATLSSIQVGQVFSRSLLTFCR